MKLRKLTNAGIRDFEDFLDNLGNTGLDPIPLNLLEDEHSSEALDLHIEVESLEFNRRYDLGAYLVDKLKTCNQQEISTDIGLWTWLALLNFDQLCPKNEDGYRKPRRNDNYVLRKEKNYHHRHAIRTTYLFVRDYGSLALFLLTNPLHKRGELTEQLSARPYHISCKGVIEAASSLYFDAVLKMPKKGAAGNTAGTCRRFAKVLKQFELTYDLYNMSRDEVLCVLPKEFEKFRPR